MWIRSGRNHSWQAACAPGVSAGLRAAPLAVLCCGTLAYFTGIGLLVPEVPVFAAGRRHLALFSLRATGGRLGGPVLGGTLRQHAGYTAVWVAATFLPLAGVAAAAACPVKPATRPPLIPDHVSPARSRPVLRAAA